MFIGTVDVYFFHNLECNTVVHPTKLLDFTIGTGVLTSKLIAGKTHHNKTAITVLLVELFEAVELRSKTTFTRRVDNQQHLALKLGKVDFLAIASQRLKTIDTVHNAYNKDN